MKTLTLFVPNLSVATPLSTIVSGSAIVGSDSGADRITVDYAGNIYQSQNPPTYEDRVNNAAGKQVERYPTKARASVPREHLRAIGTASYLPGHGWYISEISDAAALQGWLGNESLPQINGSPDFRSRVAARVSRTMRGSELMRYTMRAKQTGKPISDLIFDDLLANET